MMRTGLFALPLGFMEIIIIGVVIVLIIKAIAGSKDAGKVIAAILAVLSVIIVLTIVFAVFSFVGVRSSTQREMAVSQSARMQAATAVEQANTEVKRAEAHVKHVQADVQAEIDAKTEAVAQRVLGTSIVPGPEDPPNPGRSHEVAQADAAVADAAEVDEALSVQSGVLIAGSPWTDDVEEHQGFVADRYPSLASAAEALGRQVGGELLQHVPDMQDSDAAPVYVWMQTDDQEPATSDGVLLVTRPVLEQVADGIRQALENPAGVSVERPTSTDAIAVRISVGNMTFDFHNKWRQQTESGSGFVLAQVDTPDSDFSVKQPFEQVPWIDDPTRFAKDFKSGHWLIAYSDGTHTSHGEARQAAINTAAALLVDQAEARVAQMSPSEVHRFEQKRAGDPDWLRDRIADELESRNHLTDQFTQRFDRSYGTVWREAVLIDDDPGMMDRITDALVGSLDAQVTHQRNTWFRFIALAGLIFGTYLFLNMATKGYYAWMLRLAAVAGIIGVVLFLSFLA